MKKMMNWMLMAGMVCCLSLCMTSCSDDDNDNGTDDRPGGPSAVSADLSDDEMVLSSLLESWCDFDADTDLQPGILDKTFEPIEGDEDSVNIELSSVDRANIAAAKAREEQKKAEQEETREEQDGKNKKKKAGRKKRH